MSNEDFSAFGTLLSEKPEALDFSAFGDPVDAPAKVTPPVRTVLPPTPDQPGIMDEVRGLGRALQRGGYRARQAVNTMALTDALEMQRRVSDLEKQYADWEAQNSGKVDPTGRTDIIRDRFKRGIAMAKAQAGTSAGLSGTAAEAGQAITRDQAKIDLLPPTEGLNKWQTAEDYLGAFLDNPVEVSTSIMAESLPLSVPGMIAGTAAAGPVGTALGAGAGSFAAEYSTSILDSLVKAGIDITKPDWEKTVTDEQLKLATEYAVKRGVPVSILDGISGGLAGKFLGKAIGQGVGKIATGAIKESAMQAGTGMAGEALAQVNTGQPLDFRDILAEGIAEGPSAIYETAKNVIESKATPQQQTESKPDFSQYGKAVEQGETETVYGDSEIQEKTGPGTSSKSEISSDDSQLATVSDLRSLLEEYLPKAKSSRPLQQLEADVQQGLPGESGERRANENPYATSEIEPVQVNQNLAEELKQSLLKNQIPPIPKPSEPTKLPESIVNRAPVRDQTGTAEPTPVAIPPDQQAQPQQPEAERLSLPEERPPQERELSNYERLTGKQEDFSRQGTPVIPSKASDLQPQVDAIASKLPGAVPHEIVQSTKDLPQQIQRPDAEAAYYDGKVWIVADNIPDAETAVKKYFHEQVGHHGLRVVLGQQFEPVMRSVVSRYMGTQPMAAITEAYGLDLSKDADRLVAAEEIVARLAENPELNPTLWRRIVTEIKKAWRKLTGSAISEDEIKDMIRRAYRRLEQDPSKAEAQPRFSVPEGGYSGKREPGEGEDTRRFTRQLDASSDIDDTIKEKIQNYVYKVRSAKTDAAFAAEMVNDLGVDKAIDIFKNPTAEIPGAIRTRIGNSIIKELGRQERAARAGGRYKEADALVNKATQFIDDEFLNRSTDLGQSVQAFNDFSYLTPGGWLATAKRVIEKAGGKARKRIDPFTKKAKKIVGDINKGAVAGVVEDVAASPKAKEIVAEAASKSEAQKKEAKATAQQQLDIWSRYKNLIANSLKPVVQGMVGKSRPSPALQGFSSRVLSVLRANLEKGKEKQAPALTDIQVIAEALSNPEKYQEAWLNAGEVLREHFKDDPTALALIDASMALNPELVQNSRLDRAIAKKLKELNLKLSEIIRTHYTEENASTRLLSDKLIQEAGLSGEQALELARLVKERMATVTKERKTKALEQAIKAKDGASERKKKQLSQKIVELSNLGAFSDDMAAGEAGKLLDIPTINEQQKAEIYRQADALQQLPEDSPQRVKATVQLMNFIAKASGRKFYDLPVAFWYANVLSGPITHVYNALSNTLSLAGNLASTLARQPTSLPAAMNAAITGFRKGGSDAAETLRSGKQVTDMKFENINQLELLDDKDLKGTAKFLKYWKYVSRSMIAADQLFFASAKEAKATILARGIAKEEGLRGDALDVRVRQILGEDTRAQAEAQATTEGLTGIEFNRRVNQLVEAERDQDVQELATNFARLTTFNNEPYGLLGAIARGLNAINRETVVSRIVVPFVNIAANVTNESLNYSPIGALRAAVAHRSLSRTGEGTLHGNEITSMDPVLDAYSKAALGTMMLGMIIAYAAKNIDDDDPDFMLNGQGPKDWRRRRSLVETGWKPYSLKVGNTYISFKDTPFAIPLGVAANYLDAVRYGKLEEQDLHNRLGYAMMQIPHVIVQQSFLDSLANLLGAVDRSSEKKAGDRAIEQVLRSATSMVVPNLARQIDRIFDPTIYKSEDIQSAFIQQLPFVRRTGKPELNAFGEPVQSSPFKRFGSFETQDPLWQSLGRKYALPTPPGQGLLKDDEYYELIKVRGPILRQALETRLDIIKLQTPDQARATVRAEAAKATTRAKEQLGFKALEKTRRDEAKLKGLQTTE